MRLGLLSNDRLEPWHNWSTLAPPLFAELEKLGDARTIRPPPLKKSGWEDWAEIRSEVSSVNTLFWVQPSGRPEPSVHLASLFNLRALRSVLVYDAFEPVLGRIGLLARLQRFRPCFVAYREAQIELQRRFPRGQFEWLPFGIDTTTFAPTVGARDVFAFWMGRRHEPLHRALVEYCAARNLTYVYRQPNEYLSAKELGELAGRSRYFLVTPPDLDNPRKTGRFSPLVMRYLEGLAAGARLLGVLPKSGEYEALLPLNAICQVAPDGSDLAKKLDEDVASERATADVLSAMAQVRGRHSWRRRAEQIHDRLTVEAAGHASARGRG
jgi:hypothetical protein